ncbi:MAG: DUF3160 domain-containing protein [bacterium]
MRTYDWTIRFLARDARRRAHVAALVCSTVCVAGVHAADDDPFTLPIARVTASPSIASRASLPADWSVQAVAGSPSSPEVALLLAHDADTAVHLWRAGETATRPVDVTWPAGFVARGQATDGTPIQPIAWHPIERRLYVAGNVAGRGAIVTLAENGGHWSATTLGEVGDRVRSLLVGPRPYVTGWEPETREYRVFFGVEAREHEGAIRSLTEHGTKPYQVIGATLPKDASRYEEERPSAVVAPWSEPEAFHPAGDRMIWRDAKGCHQLASYGRQSWTSARALTSAIPCGGVLSVPPNGDGLLRWQSGAPGVTLFVGDAGSSSTLAGDVTFTSAPAMTPDGRGLVGALVGLDGRTDVAFVPVAMPLGDVANAWMFASTADDRSRFARDGGLFRPLAAPQLYSLYDTERYQCGGLDTSASARPYLVTTDVFWEVFAAAYEGLFLVDEKSRAIPAFWSLVDAGSKAAAASKDPAAAKWSKVFKALAAVKKGDRSNAEAARILAARGRGRSALLGIEVDYADLAPRGHYTATPERSRYFAAFRYLTAVPVNAADAAFLAALPESVRALATAWAAPYRELKAPARVPSAWGETAVPPSYARHAPTTASLFPLGWGRDSEALWRTVFHEQWPSEEQIAGEKGPRALPSGLDVAAALGSAFARALLDESGVIALYPQLGSTLDQLARDLAARTPAAARPESAIDASTDLYDAWLGALAVQWSGGVPAPGGAATNEAERLWQTKRLQTGLASWATLRHATVLVNERSVAECGEGGFEPIVMDPPRGYVEPDPATFDAIARLFEGAAALVARDPTLARTKSPIAEDFGDASSDASSDAPSHAREIAIGLGKRLEASAAKARLFGAMARKEVLGEELSPADYQEIFDVGRVAEHHVLVYRSLARDDLALSNPDPMPRVADVADGRAAGGGLLLVGVGFPLEWDQVVPFHGRRQIVKGPVYGYYEVERDAPMDDATWRKEVTKVPRPRWVAPFVGGPPCECAPEPRF